MDFDDFMLLREGWNEKILFEQRTLRRVAELIMSAQIGGKNVHIEQWWPLQGDKGGRVVKMVTYRGVEMTEGQARKLKRLKESNG